MNNWNVGDRVSLHPCTNEWTQGDRFGEVVGHGRRRDYIDTLTKEWVVAKPIKVKLDRSGRVRRFHPDNVCPIN